MKTTIINALGTALLCASGIPMAHAEDLTVNRLLASQCAQCHGTNGNAVGDIDDLRGESAREIYGEMMEMRSEGRPNDIMEHQALGYTEDQIRRIASYYGMLSGGSGEHSDSEHDSDEWEERERDHEEYERRERRRYDD